jgi:hypothetical protein
MEFSMKIHRVEFDTKHGQGFFLLWVCAWDTHDWRLRGYMFRHRDEKVYFMYGGARGEERFAGEAQNRDEAIEVAAKYLEWWLKKCDALERPGRPPADCNNSTSAAH